MKLPSYLARTLAVAVAALCLSPVVLAMMPGALDTVTVPQEQNAVDDKTSTPLQQQTTPEEVPEPMSVALLGLGFGLCALALARRRR
jgi:hypothetical protein